jgi:hypothetical protein
MATLTIKNIPEELRERLDLNSEVGSRSSRIT